MFRSYRLVRRFAVIRYEDLLEARDHLHPEIIRTPLQTWRYASTRLGGEVKIKLETLQRTGSFKARGAWNFLRRLRPAERRAGVICCSAGNHAQGVALACSLLDVQATVVMPETSPEIKILQTRLYGKPEIILHGESIQDALGSSGTRTYL